MTELNAVLLVGGKGTRLRPVLSQRPKPLASVGERPFLDLLVRQLRHQGIRHLIMCTGHLAEQIEREFGNGSDWGVEIQYSPEPNPLGTAGAVKFAEKYLRGVDDFLVMNGDSFLQIDFQRLHRFHLEKHGLVTLAVRRVENTQRFGTVHVDDDGRVTGFREKSGAVGPGLVNGGVYVFNQAVLGRIGEGPGSLEKDVFPGLLEAGVYAAEQRGLFIDIGTPEDYAQARTIYGRLLDAATADPDLWVQPRLSKQGF